MRISITIVLLILLPFIAFKSYNLNDKNLAVAKSIFAEKEAEFEESKENWDYLANKNVIKVKRKSQDSPIPYEEVVTFANGATTNEDKILIFGYAAIGSFKFGEIKNGEFYISACKACFKGTNPTLSENAIFEIVDALLELDAKEAQTAAVDLLFGLYYTPDMVFRFYKFFGKKYASEYILKLSKEPWFRQQHRGFLLYMAKARIIRNTFKYSEEYILSKFKYSALEFSSGWRGRNWENYKIPFIAYVYYCGGNKKMYEKYRNLSVSKEQLYDMRGAYFSYIEYASKIYCLTGDTQTAISLLKTLPNGHSKNLILKRLTRYLTQSKDAYLSTRKSGLFD